MLFLNGQAKKSDVKMKCQLCKEDVDLPYCCSYCGQYFCDDHRLPEQHFCPGLPKKSWNAYKKFKSKIMVKMPFKLAKGVDIERNTKIREVKKVREVKKIKPIRKKRFIGKKIFFLVAIIVFSFIIYDQFEPSINDLHEYVEDAREIMNNTLNRLKEVSVELENQVSNLTSTQIDVREIEILIFNYTNIERKNHGLNELVWDEQLMIIAREHSEDMFNNSFFSHVNPKGEGPTDRARRHGYKLYKDLGGGWYSEGIAENIGKMPIGNVLGVGNVDDDADSIAKAQVKTWMNSIGHRENILNPNYDKMGIGVSYDGTYYISTQNFW